MSEKGYISKETLPLGQNYQGLRALGMDYIQKNSGEKWTNLNPSDPGVTFLDELCFALTELGYCADFPMEDLLTVKDGSLALDGQFYLPENILTTSPITLKDYRKYLIDKVRVVENVVISKSIVDGKVTYKAFIKISADIINEELKVDGETVSVYEAICIDVKSCFDRCRNLAVHIDFPVILVRELFPVAGSISLNHKDDLMPFLNDLLKACENYIFPSVVPVLYHEIVDWENNVNTIFEGPFLESGWISDAALGEKKDALNSFELVNVIRSLKQVRGVNKLEYSSGTNSTKISVNEGNLIKIDWKESVISGGLEIYANGQLLEVTADMFELNVDSNQESKPNYTQTFNSASDIKGSFRDVNTYYSIQETLPDIYAVGANALQEHDSDIKKGQSKQLKGYLTLFDQIMANQLSQMANLSTLFSFENVTIGTPSDFQNYVFGKSKLEQLNPEFPAAYRVYSPAYFYQSLYSVPDIRPLLKGFDAFDFTMKTGAKRQLENDSWNKFKSDPYNPYMKGLMNLTTNEDGNLNRRNAMLNHLIARHGESPDVIDQLIDGSSYAGSKLKDQLVFKSLLLQNFGTLSYNRVRSYSICYADELTVDYGSLFVPIKTYQKEIENFDFILDAGLINEAEKVSLDDCRNFAVIELKLSLLLGLKPLYKGFLLNWFDINKTPEQIEAYSKLKPKPQNGAKEDTSKVVDNDFPKSITQINWLLLEKRGVLFFESSYLSLVGQENSLEDLVFIMPAYATIDISSQSASDGTVVTNTSPNFKARFELCLLESLPVDLTYQVKYATQDEMDDVINAYIPWFNMQRSQPLTEVIGTFEDASLKLFNVVNAIPNE